jgi:hypothetical protein
MVMVTFDEIKQKLDAIESKLDEIEKDYRAYQDVSKVLAEELESLIEWESSLAYSPALAAYKKLTGEK